MTPASGFVGNLLITLRAVLPLDKGMAIAFELCTAGILVHIPGKFIYKALADATCQYPSKDGYSCSLHDANFGDIISIVTSGIFLISALMDCIVTYLVGDLLIFALDENDTSNGGHDLQERPVQLNRRITNSEDANSDFIRPARPRIAIRNDNPEEMPLNRESNVQSLPRYSDLDDEIPGYQRSYSPRVVTAEVSPDSSGFRSITPEMNRVGLPIQDPDELNSNFRSSPIRTSNDLESNRVGRPVQDSEDVARTPNRASNEFNKIRVGLPIQSLDQLRNSRVGLFNRNIDEIDGTRSGSEEPRSSSSQGSDNMQRVRPQRPPKPVKSMNQSGRAMNKEELPENAVPEFKQYKSTMI